jgi:hypothetical protein
MVLRQYSVAKGLGVIIAFVIFIIIIGMIFTSFLPLFERGSSTATFGFPSSSYISSVSGVNVTFKEQGQPIPANGSTITYDSGIVSGEHVYYNSTSHGYFELFEFKASSSVNSSNIYSHYYAFYNRIWRGNTSKDSISTNLSLLGFTYFYFRWVAFIPVEISIGFMGNYIFLLAYFGNAMVNINNVAEAVIMQM